jgi:hypothetical protein
MMNFGGWVNLEPTNCESMMMAHLDQPEKQRCMLIVDSFLSLEECIADGPSIWALSRLGNAIGIGILLVVALSGRTDGPFTGFTLLEPVAIPFVGTVPPRRFVNGATRV